MGAGVGGVGGEGRVHQCSLLPYEAVVMVIAISDHRIEFSIIGPRKMCDHFYNS